MFSFSNITINPSLAYETEEERDRVLEILDDNPFVKKTIFGVFGDFANDSTLLEMESVSLMGQQDKTSVYLQIVIEGVLVHKVRWYHDKQEEIFNKLLEWFGEIEGLDLSVLITLIPTPVKHGTVTADVGLG